MNSLSEDIICLINKKDETAFNAMFHLYYPRLVYFAKEYVPYEDARGFVQDAFVVFWDKNPIISNENQLRSYLYTLVKNNCLMYLRHQAVRSNYIKNVHAKHLQTKVYQFALERLDTSEVTFKEMESIIAKTIDSLPPRCREVFILSRYKGKKNKEIATDLDITVKAVEAQITAALKILKIALRDFLPILSFLFI